ncbi:hypothetical protein evm_003504 [Chilo suppressalis]|nr:hypothetical protein evm_003504 [Chilo suppressalis]
MTWIIIKNKTGKSKTRNNNNSLNIDDKKFTSDIEVAKVFENFFTDIPVSTTKSLNSSPIAAESILRENVKPCTSYFHFKHVDFKDVIKTFHQLNKKKTADLWGNSVDVSKSVIETIAPILACIFNDCVDCGVFPDLMKYSKITPLHKSGSTSDPTNFRPISVLPTFSKIFEKIMLDQMQSHFNKYNILHCKQFGFTRGRSTTDAGVELIQQIFDAWENSQDALGVFCDLSKAFDCVFHDTLLRKLHHYGFRDTDLDLIASYLRDRIERVDINDTFRIQKQNTREKRRKPDSQEYDDPDSNEEERDGDMEYTDVYERKVERRRKRSAPKEEDSAEVNSSESDNPTAETEFIITLRPTQIRTFVIWFHEPKKPL